MRNGVSRVSENSAVLCGTRKFSGCNEFSGVRRGVRAGIDLKLAERSVENPNAMLYCSIRSFSLSLTCIEREAITAVGPADRLHKKFILCVIYISAIV